MGFLKERSKQTYSKGKFSVNPPFPRAMMVELTNLCNHACIFCFNQHSTRKPGFIDESLLMSVLGDAYRLGTREVGFYTTGETLTAMSRVFVDAHIYYAKHILGYDYVYISTNGSLMSPGVVTRLVDAGIDSIKLSINAATRETYRLIHGVDQFDRVMDNLLYLAHLPSVPVKTGVSFILTDENRHERELAEDTIGMMVDDIVFWEEGIQGGYRVPDRNPQKTNTAPCPMVFNRFHVTYEGYFTLCCVDYQNYLAVADLDKVSLETAWNSDLAVDMRKRHLSKDLTGTMCHRCITGEGDIKPLVSEYATTQEG